MRLQNHVVDIEISPVSIPVGWSVATGMETVLRMATGMIGVAIPVASVDVLRSICIVVSVPAAMSHRAGWR